MSDTIYDTDDTDPIVPRSPLLQKVEPDLGPEKPIDLNTDRAPRLSRPRAKPRKNSEAEGNCAIQDVALFTAWAPNNTEFSRFDPLHHVPLSGGDCEEDFEMGDVMEDPGGLPVVGAPPTSSEDDSTNTKPEPPKSPRTKASFLANAALNATESLGPNPDGPGQPTMERNDSAHDEPQPLPEPQKALPLRVDTNTFPPQRENSLTASPTLRKHIIPSMEGAAGTLPALQSSPAKDGQATSPQAEKLPSVRQITGHLGDSSLNELAELATQRDPRPHRHSQSIGSSASQPSMLAFNPPPAAHASPPGQYAPNAGSPASAVSDQFYPPPYYHQSMLLHPRRTSAANTPNYPSMPSASSSCDSGTTHSTPMEQGSTSHTTPIDMGSLPDGSPGRTLPPIPGMPPLTGYKCDYPGCQAPPFQTQYLLSSHRNVHSQTRNFFCPVEGCKHSEGGKGFKRKNEMNRHALVHKSPGFTCPFCPDREHKYPRPDNLQRHVRVHHVDKGSNDPQLREVLAQKNDGTGKSGRRQRRPTSSPVQTS